MSNQWVYFSKKKNYIILIVCFLSVVTLDVWTELMVTYIPLHVILVSIGLIITVIGGISLLKGVHGLFSKTTYGNAHKFGREYKLSNRGVASRSKEYAGTQRIIVSIISIILGVLFLIAGSLILIQIVFR